MGLKYNKENIAQKVHNRTVSDFDSVVLVENDVEKSMNLTDVFTDIDISKSIGKPSPDKSSNYISIINDTTAATQVTLPHDDTTPTTGSLAST